jgi:hypothetical protein
MKSRDMREQQVWHRLNHSRWPAKDQRAKKGLMILCAVVFTVLIATFK